MSKAALIEEIIKLWEALSRFKGHGPGAWLDLNLTIGQLKSLFFIDFEGSTNFSRLASALGVTPPNVTGIIDRLVEQGLVNRQENPQNRRMQLLTLTEKGKALLARLRESGINRISGLLNRLSEPELAALTQGLAAVARAVRLSQGETPDTPHN